MHGIISVAQFIIISPQHWSLSPLRLAPVELDLTRVFLHHFALTKPRVYKTQGCTITVPALSAQSPGNFLRVLNCPKKETRKAPRQAFRGPITTVHLWGHHVQQEVNATYEINVQCSYLGGLGCLILPAEGDKGISGQDTNLKWF